MLNTKELIGRLDAKGVKNRDIARTLNVTPSRVTEIKNGTRAVKLDEAVKLVEAFGLDEAPAALVPVPAVVWRLVGHHIASTLELPLEPDDPRLQELIADLAAFSRFVADPQVRGSLESAEAFFRALSLRRSSAPASPPENSPQPVR